MHRMDLTSTPAGHVKAAHTCGVTRASLAFLSLGPKNARKAGGIQPAVASIDFSKEGLLLVLV
jgi:hypothetical protein